MLTCKLCQWYELYIEENFDEGILETGLCHVPKEFMPICMQGYAQRDRELVLADATGCPTHKLSAEALTRFMK